MPESTISILVFLLFLYFVHTLLVKGKDGSNMFANRIKYLRQTRELTQVQLADKLGVAKQSISNWENDNIMPSVDMLEKIADFFSVSTDYLLERENRKNANGNIIDVTGLSPHQIDHIMLIVEDLRNS